MAETILLLLQICIIKDIEKKSLTTSQLNVQAAKAEKSKLYTWSNIIHIKFQICSFSV